MSERIVYAGLLAVLFAAIGTHALHVIIPVAAYWFMTEPKVTRA